MVEQKLKLGVFFTTLNFFVFLDQIQENCDYLSIIFNEKVRVNPVTLTLLLKEIHNVTHACVFGSVSFSLIDFV